MNSQNNKQYACIAFGFLFLAVLLSIVPMPVFLQWCRPQWVLLVIISVALQWPSMVSLIPVWLLGLFMDLLKADVIGVHAALFVLVCFVVRRLNRWLLGLPMWQMTLGVGVVVFLYSLSQCFLHYFVGLATPFSSVFFSTLINVMIWFLMYLIIVQLKKRYQPLY